MLGAPEMLRPHLQQDVDLDGQGEEWTAHGLRVLLFAYQPEPVPLHDGTDQASSSVDQASNSVAAGIKLQFQMTELQNAKNMAEMVANAIKGLGNTAKSAGQGLAGQ